MSRALLDTHLLLWAAIAPHRLPRDVAAALSDGPLTPVYSVASLWEVTIKAGQGRADFEVDPNELRRGLLAAGYRELAIEARHALAVADLPALHGDPFDRLMLAQARIERLPFWTVDRAVLRYGSPAEDVG
ncbi:type II toxin-antitoxin system VapC family toxin [Jannaschia sp. LMIT008]|uniref:type II toxin-antitoxin system VapC family toxin n=1 Tax=Jannaschia maritima TaxID=3032585 RepID=UPI0028110406|nr:type II toxin-antitoxin system VapC family toxin [Jannaschia sp. LMIT008]